MTPEPSSDAEPASGIQRYVPLLVYAVVILTLFFIPLKIMSYGYLPLDDALRHAAKAVSGKSWPEILVVADWYKVDHNIGWHGFLTFIHKTMNCGTEGLVFFAVVSLFTLVGWSALPWMRRPEAWLAGVLACVICTSYLSRYMLGRPFLLSVSLLITILLAYLKYESIKRQPTWRFGLLLVILFATAIYVHGVWYLWALLIGSFLLARQFRWAGLITVAWAAGTLLGAAATGHPYEYLKGAVDMARMAFEMHQTQRTQVTEFQPFFGDFSSLVLFAGFLTLRKLCGFDSRPLTSNPAFWLAATSWALGFKAVRFWEDWGRPGMLVLMAWEIQPFFQARFPTHSLQRLFVTCCLAATTFLACTNDAGSRWTKDLTGTFLSKDDPECAGWLPENGGILYSSQMSVFYRTFFKNPRGDWRYILGYEPVLMPREDFETYHSILWNFGDAKAYKPWVDKMRREDRLAFYGSKAEKPNIPELEWHYPVSGIWVGRIPLTNPPPTATSATNTITN